MVGDGNHRYICCRIEAHPHTAIFRRIADRIADQVEQDLQYSPKFGYGELTLALRRRVKFDTTFPCSDTQNAAGLSRNIAQIDPVRRCRKATFLYDGQIGQIIHQRE